MTDRLSQNSPVKPAIRPNAFSAVEETLFDEADVADVAVLEFADPARRGSVLAVLGRIMKRKRFIAAALLSVIVVIGLAFWRAGYFAPESIFTFLDSYPVIAPLVFLVIFVLMTLLLLPTLPLNLGAGAVWGTYWGGFYTVLGASIGAALAFLISRYMVAGFVHERFRHPTWRWLTRQVADLDWKAVAFTRVNPIFPTAPLNYFFGLTAISFWHYLLSTVLFITPMAILFAYLGDSVGGYLLRGEDYRFVQKLLTVSAALTLLVLLRVALQRFGGQRTLTPPPDQSE